MSLRLGILHSRIRQEEKLILAALKQRGVLFDMIDDRQVIFPMRSTALPSQLLAYDLILERCTNHSRALYALRILADHGIETINRFETASVCGDKLLTTSALNRANVRCPRTVVAFTPESALQAIEVLGYPVVLKPGVGSWGRLLAKVNDREAAEAILEHKQVLGTYHHSIFYIQEHIAKPQRDIRAFVIGDETVCAIYRRSDHWITNTARGGRAENCPITPELNDLCLAAARAVGGGILGIDILEDADRGYLVNEVNYTIEFRNSIDTTGVNIAERVVDYIQEAARRKTT